MENSNDNDEKTLGRRELLKAIAGAGGIVASRLLLPALWSAPILASMPLPAHASLSNPECTGAPFNALGTEVPASAANLQAKISNTTITITFNLPSAVVAGRLPYQLYEQETAVQTLITGTCVVALYMPGHRETTQTTKTVTRGQVYAKTNTYKYQLRWSGGYTSWVTAIESGRQY